ncbi:MAG: SirB2 family protein [Gammaproteobacteria bacterium]|nr:SirB2 family protein [Gammaproteobacteria bacterium]
MLASCFPAILMLHIGCAALSGTLFATRGVLRLLDRPLAGHRALRLTSYLIDTLLLAAAVLLMLIIRQYPLTDGWLTLKVLLLVVYIGLGMATLKWAHSRGARAAAFVGALLTFCAIVAVAVVHTH